MTYLVIMRILTAHWIADFCLQSDWMARNKSKDMRPLLVHILVYTTAISILMLNPLWGIANGLLHLATDYITSRITSRLYAKGDIHNFFVVIGLDQLLHYAALFGTWRTLGGA